MRGLESEGNTGGQESKNANFRTETLWPAGIRQRPTGTAPAAPDGRVQPRFEVRLTDELLGFSLWSLTKSKGRRVVKSNTKLARWRARWYVRWVLFDLIHVSICSRAPKIFGDGRPRRTNLTVTFSYLWLQDFYWHRGQRWMCITIQMWAMKPGWHYLAFMTRCAGSGGNHRHRPR